MFLIASNTMSKIYSGMACLNCLLRQLPEKTFELPVLHMLQKSPAGAGTVVVFEGIMILRSLE